MRRLITRYPHIRAFVAARFARGEYLGLHLTVGLGISLIGVLVFASVTRSVFRSTSLVHFDLWLLAQLQLRTQPGWHMIAQAVTVFGSMLLLLALAVTAGSMLAMRRQWLLLQGWVIALAGGELLNLVLKAAFQRPRPVESEILSSQSWSFPSGHAMLSLVAYGMFVYLLTVLASGRGWRRFVLIGCAALLILAIGFSRIYLGVHHFSDVVAGYAAGALWLSLCVSALEVARRRAALLRGRPFQRASPKR